MNPKIDDGGLAFPGTRFQQVGFVSDYGFSDEDSPTFADVHHPGMSLRDWFAGQALAGHLAGEPGSHLLPERLAPACYDYADAMIKARSMAAIMEMQKK